MKSVKRYDRISQLHRLLRAKHQQPLSLRRIAEELECSERTAKRCISDLPTMFDHPIKYDQERGGYYYDLLDPTYLGCELPGLWFTESELRSLLAVRKLLADVEPGVFEADIAPLGERIERLLEQTGAEAGEVAKRIRVVGIGRRRILDRVFRWCADAVLRRARMRFLYQARSRPSEGERERYVSPQRLVHYRDNWYLDGWCHEQDALRIFALDQMREPRLLDEAAIDVADAELDRVLKSAYGIFAGEPEATAVLRFSPERGQWVANESWHPSQSGRFLEDGSWELRVPYSKPDELVMDVLKHGAEVEVLEPAKLRERVAGVLAEAGAIYGDTVGVGPVLSPRRVNVKRT